MSMKKKAAILSFLGVSILTLGLQSQQTFASTYKHTSNRYCVSRSSRWHSNRDHYYNWCQNIPVKPEANPDMKPTPKPEIKPDVKPVPKPDVKPVPKPEIKPGVKPVPKPESKPDVKPVPKPEAKPDVDVSINNFETKVVELTNMERAKHGLAELKMDSQLSKVAKLKSQDIRDQGYFDHTSPTYGSPFDMMRQFGIVYRSAGENIAKGQQTPEVVVNAWMNSPGHRENILGNYTHMGVGHIASGNVWTQMFISK